MKKNPFEVIFCRNHDILEHLQSEYIILYLVSGKAQLVTSGKSYEMEPESVHIVNCDRLYKLNLAGESLLVKIEIDKNMICDLTHNRNLMFNCHSYENAGIKYEKFRYIIGELLGDYAIEPGGINCQKMAKLFNICDYMIRLFAISQSSAMETNSNDKTERVLHYIEEHYDEKISLSEIAAHMYMAPASFSRFFSKQMGMTFVNYITKVRLDHAMNDLFNSDLSISEIAMENGFGSVSQFNKQFKQYFQKSPRDYKSEKLAIEQTQCKEENNQIADALKDYRSKTRLTVVKEQKIQLQSIEVDTADGEILHNPWGSMICLGFTSRLLSAEYQKQILFMKQQLNFSIGSINGLFSPELKLWEEDGDEELNFVNFDYVLDFLVENKIIPLLVFDDQALNMVKELENDTIQCVDIFKTLGQCRKVIGSIIEHILYRYGAGEVSNWKFVIWYDTFNRNTLGLKDSFDKVWDVIYEEIRTRIPEASIGGSGMSPTVSRKELVSFYTKWRRTENIPDFITINSFPYRESEGVTKTAAIRRNVDDFFLEDLEQLKLVLKEAAFYEAPICISEWNLSFVQRNYFNDMVGKAAIMMKHMIQGINEAESVCYWPASDLHGGDYDANKILNGACGLISADGICKPTFYALAFFKELQRILVARGEHYIVTKDDRGHFTIILFNNKKLNYNYYSKSESEICIEDRNVIFENDDALEVTMKLQSIPNKEYLVRKQTISSEEGSVLDEWGHLGIDSQINMGDLRYLKSRSVPYRKNEKIRVTNQQIVLREHLNAHEILLLQLI